MQTWVFALMFVWQTKNINICAVQRAAALPQAEHLQPTWNEERQRTVVSNTPILLVCHTCISVRTRVCIRAFPALVSHYYRHHTWLMCVTLWGACIMYPCKISVLPTVHMRTLVTHTIKACITIYNDLWCLTMIYKSVSCISMWVKQVIMVTEWYDGAHQD